MSDTNPSAGGTPESGPTSGSTAAQEAFGKYKARLLGGPAAMLATPPGWAMPPSMGTLPNYPLGFPYGPQGFQQPHPIGSLTERLGESVRLGIDLLNAVLASGAGALRGGMAAYPSDPWGAPGGGCDRCGYDCCGVMDGECCRPGVHGCGCCC